MITAPTRWDALWGADGTTMEAEFSIGSKTYGNADIVGGSLKLSHQLYDSYGIGNACAAKLEVTLVTDDEMPVGAAVAILRVRLVNGSTASGWAVQGTYYLDTADLTESGTAKLVLYDGLALTDRYLYDGGVVPSTETYPKNALALARLVRAKCGLTLDESNKALWQSVSCTAPEGMTCRQILQSIAAAAGGNWTITKANKLKFVRVGDLTTATQSGATAQAQRFSRTSTRKTVLAVALHGGEDTFARGGSGYRLDAQCAFASDANAAIAESNVSGRQYQGFSATGAFTTPLVELGDLVAVEGAQSMLLDSYSFAYQQGCWGDMASPLKDEVEKRIGNIDAKARAEKITQYVQEIREVERIIDSGEIFDGLLDALNAQANETGGWFYYVEGQGVRTYDVQVSDPAVGREASQATEIKGGLIRIANSKDAQGNWQWRTLIESGHIASDLVTAVKVTSGYIGSPSGNMFLDLDNNIIHLGSTEDVWSEWTNRAFNTYYKNTKHFSIDANTQGAYMTFGTRSGLESTHGIGSIALGSNCVASGDMSIAAGGNTTVAKPGETSKVWYPTASGRWSVSFGAGNVASGTPSAAFGSATMATGSNSFASGTFAEANGAQSVAFGYSTIANGVNQVVLGKYNSANTTSALIVGNGTGASARANAYTLDFNGNTRQAGNGFFDGYVVIGDGTAQNQTYLSAKTPGRTGRVLFVGGGVKQDGDVNGTVVGLGAGGLTLVGGGEYATNRYNVGDLNDTDERLYLGADGYVYIESNGNTIGDRKTWAFTTGGSILAPTTIDGASAPSTDIDAGYYVASLKSGDHSVRVLARQTTTNKIAQLFEVGRYINGSWKWNTFSVGMDANGDRTYSVSDPEAFRSAIASNLNSGVHLIQRATNIDRDGSVSSATWGNSEVRFQDKDGERIGLVNVRQHADGRMQMWLAPRTENADGAEVGDGISIYAAQDGAVSYAVAEPSKFRDAIGASSGVWPVSLGGTGATTDKAARNSLLGGMNDLTSTNNVTDSTMLVAAYVSPTASNGAIYKYKAQKFWDYFKGKSDAVYLPLAGGTLTGWLYGKYAAADRSDTTTSTGTNFGGFDLQDKNGNANAFVHYRRMAADTYGIEIGGSNAGSGASSNTYNSLMLGVKSDGTRYVYTQDPAAWRGALGAVGASHVNGYYGITRPDGNDTAFIRTTSQGLIPYESGGASNLGTATWPFANLYAKNIYHNGAKLGSLATKSSLAEADIPNLPASKVTSGTFDAARIPSITLAKVSDAGKRGDNGSVSKIGLVSATIWTDGNAQTVEEAGKYIMEGEWFFPPAKTAGGSRSIGLRFMVGSNAHGEMWVPTNNVNNPNASLRVVHVMYVPANTTVTLQAWDSIGYQNTTASCALRLFKIGV